MDYISFDIECANSYNGRAKICSFGYCIADAQLRVTEKRDIIVNPKSRFNPGMTKSGEIVLAYTKEQFRAAPDFAAVYPEIKSLLEAPNRVAIGHSVLNDVGFLRAECARYRLPQLEYDYIDAQTIHHVDSATEHVMSLDKIADEYGIEFIPHKSDDDAYATVLYLAAICAKNDLPVDRLLAKYGIRAGHAGRDPVAMTCAALAKPKRKKSLEKFVNFVRCNQSVNKNGIAKGMRLCVPLGRERADLDASFEFVRAVNEAGIRYVLHARDCNTFLLPTTERPDPRCQAARVRASQGKPVRFVTETELTQLMNRVSQGGIE